MSDPAENKGANVNLRLADAVREVKNAAADREDVVVELREAQKMRLPLPPMPLLRCPPQRTCRRRRPSNTWGRLAG